LCRTARPESPFVFTAERRARKQRGWSQSQLAERVGVRQGTISLIETGNPATKLDTLLAILAALELELQVGSRVTGSTSGPPGPLPVNPSMRPLSRTY
jgi:HTH-type transcriptional regulator / antitoxin HipB